MNERIRVPMVRVISPEGNQLGIMAISEALKLAQLQNLDLVEVSPKAKPPVCRIMDFGKYKYEMSKHERQAKKKHHTYTIKEVKLRAKTEEHDLSFKVRNARKFLIGKDKVKFTCIFRGREMSHQGLGMAVLQKVTEELADIAFVETPPAMEGRALVMILAPRKDVKAQTSDQDMTEERESAAPATPRVAASGKPSRAEGLPAAPEE